MRTVTQNLQSSSKSNDYGNNITQANYLNICLQITTLSFKLLETAPALQGEPVHQIGCLQGSDLNH